jgi:hypothetical protein
MWTRLDSAAQWEEYRRKTAKIFCVESAPIAWGHGPKEYPCLVVTTAIPNQNPISMISAYVYKADAEILLPPVAKLTEQDNTVQCVNTVGAKQEDFNRWISAVTLTVAWFLKNTGICTAEGYEKKLAESLSLVDEIVTQRNDALKASLDINDKAMLDRLLPPG